MSDHITHVRGRSGSESGSDMAGSPVDYQSFKQVEKGVWLWLAGRYSDRGNLAILSGNDCPSVHCPGVQKAKTIAIQATEFKSLLNRTKKGKMQKSELEQYSDVWAGNDCSDLMTLDGWLEVNGCWHAFTFLAAASSCFHLLHLYARDAYDAAPKCGC